VALVPAPPIVPDDMLEGYGEDIAPVIDVDMLPPGEAAAPVLE